MNLNWVRSHRARYRSVLEPALNSAGTKSVVDKEESIGSCRSTTHEEAAVKRRTHRNLLVRFKDIERWYNNLSRGSKITADVYLRRIGSLCSLKGITPVELAERARADERWAYNFLIDLELIRKMLIEPHKAVKTTVKQKDGEPGFPNYSSFLFGADSKSRV